MYFLSLSSRKFDDRLSSNTDRFVVLCICWDTPSDETGLWQSLLVSSVFKAQWTIVIPTSTQSQTDLSSVKTPGSEVNLCKNLPGSQTTGHWPFVGQAHTETGYQKRLHVVFCIWQSNFCAEQLYEIGPCTFCEWLRSFSSPWSIPVRGGFFFFLPGRTWVIICTHTTTNVSGWGRQNALQFPSSCKDLSSVCCFVSLTSAMSLIFTVRILNDVSTP